MGPLKHVTVSCKGGGLGGAWHLAHLTITHPVTQAVTRFDYNNWFDGTQGWVQVSECAAAAPGEYIVHCVHPSCAPVETVGLVQKGGALATTAHLQRGADPYIAAHLLTPTCPPALFGHPHRRCCAPRVLLLVVLPLTRPSCPGALRSSLATCVVPAQTLT